MAYDNDSILSSPIHLLVSGQDELSDGDGLVPVPLLQLAPKKRAQQAKPCPDRSAMTISSSLKSRKGKSFFDGNGLS